MNYNYTDAKEQLTQQYSELNITSLLLPISKKQTDSSIIEDSAISGVTPNMSKHALEQISNLIITQKIPDAEAPQYGLLSPTVMKPTTTEMTRLARRRIGKVQKKSTGSNTTSTSGVVFSRVKYGGQRFHGGVDWDPFDADMARVSGIDLYMELLEAEKIAMSMDIDHYRLVGDGEGVTGFLNHDQVPIITNDNNLMDLIEKGDFDAVAGIFVTLRNSILENSFYMVTPDTFILSEKIFNALNSVRSGVYQNNATNVNLMDFLMMATRMPKKTGGYNSMNFISSKRLIGLPGYNNGIKITDADRTRIICARLGGETKEKDLMGFHDWIPFKLYVPVLKDLGRFNQYMEQGTSRFYLLDDKIMTYLDIKISNS